MKKNMTKINGPTQNGPTICKFGIQKYIYSCPFKISGTEKHHGLNNGFQYCYIYRITFIIMLLILLYKMIIYGSKLKGKKKVCYFSQYSILFRAFNLK